MGMQAKWLGVFFALLLAGCAVPLSSGGEEQRVDRAPIVLSTTLPSLDQGEIDWVEVWKQAPYIQGKRPHGYKQGFTDVEILVVNDNSVAHQRALAAGGDPGSYAIPIARATMDGFIERSECSLVLVRLSNMAANEKFGPLPIRGDKAGRDADFRGVVEFEKIGDGFFEAEVPLYNGRVSVVFPNDVMTKLDDPIMRLTVPGANSLLYLPEPNTGEDYMVSYNMRDNNKNDFKRGARAGAVLYTPILEAGSCASA